MTTFILVRHGESEANKQEIFAGHLNVKLTELGHAQARETAAYVAEHYPFTAAYASDLYRAYHTGKPAADLLQVELVPDEALREIYEGKWSGEHFPDLPVKYGKAFSVWLNDIGHARCTDGESTEELLTRVKNELVRIAGLHDGETVLIATHATPIRAMQSYVQTGSLEAMKDIPWVTNASVSVLEYDDGKWCFKMIGEDAHLGALRTDRPRNV